MKKIINGVGNLDSNIVIVGEAPDAEEENVGLPFVGKSGETLMFALAKAGVERHEVYLTNVVKYRPSNNIIPSKLEIEKRKSFLLEEIKLIQPRVVLCLGEVASQILLGQNINLAKNRGILIPTLYNYRVMPTFHPAYVNKFEDKLLDIFVRDVKLAIGEANEKERSQSYTY